MYIHIYIYNTRNMDRKKKEEERRKKKGRNSVGLREGIIDK